MSDRLLMLWYRFRWLVILVSIVLAAAGGVVARRVEQAVTTPAQIVGADAEPAVRAGATIVVRDEDAGLQACIDLDGGPLDPARVRCVDRLVNAAPVLLEATVDGARFLAGASWFGADGERDETAAVAAVLENAVAGVVVDLDNDTFDELVVLVPAAETGRVAVRVFTRGGDGALLDTTTERGGLTVPSYNELLAADWNEDGFIDLVLYDGGGADQPIRVLLNGGRNNPGTLVPSDLGLDQARALINASSGNAVRSTDITARRVRAAAVRDLDANGHQDLVFVTGNGVGGVLWGAGADGFTAQALPVPVPAGATDLAVHDVNRDGAVDLIVTYDPTTSPGVATTEGGFTVYLGSRRWDFTASDELSVDDRSGVRALAVADLDNDTWEEIVLGTESVTADADGGLWVYRPALGTGGVLNGFDVSTNRFEQPQPAVSRIAAADIDGDGDIDLVLSGRGNSPLRWWRNDLDATSYLRVVARGAGRLDALGSNYAALGAIVEIIAPRGIYRAEIGSLDGRGGTGRSVVHVGVGDASTVNVRVTFPASGRTVERRDVAVNQTLVIDEPAN